MASVGAIFQLHITQKTATGHPCPTSPASCVVIYSQLAACPVEMEPFKHHPTLMGI